MPAKKRYRVFISYSHEDAQLVDQLYELIAFQRSDTVFLDTKSIRKGKRWQESLQQALSQAQGLIVFWCCHSAKSRFVKSEYRVAIKQGKDVLPVLIDFTKLPKELSAYQRLNLTSSVIHIGPKIVPGSPGKMADPESIYILKEKRHWVEAKTSFLKPDIHKLMFEASVEAMADVLLEKLEKYFPREST